MIAADDYSPKGFVLVTVFIFVFGWPLMVWLRHWLDGRADDEPSA